VIDIPLATQLSDGELVSAVTRLVAEGRQRTADLIALLVALETRTVHVEAGYGSLFRFCVGRLGLSEEEAFYRIAASRVAERFPVVLEWLRDGRLTLTAIALLRKHLTEANHLSMLEAAEGRSKREIQALVARLAPRPDVPVSIRRLAPPRTVGVSLEATPDPPIAPAPIFDAVQTPGPAAPALPLSQDDCVVSAPAGPAALAVSRGEGDARRAPAIALRSPVPSPPPAVMTPLAPGRYSLRLTISEETHAKLRRAQDLLAHAVPPGDTAAVLDRALTLLVAQLERQKYAALRERPKVPASPMARRRAPRRPATPATDPIATAKPATGSAATAKPSTGSVERATAATSSVSAAKEPPPPSSAMLGLPGASPGTAPPAPEKDRPTRRTRYIPAAVRREVWRREGGRCGYLSRDGNRCAETAGLEFHHTIPVADGGAATAATVVLRCKRHHELETRRWFGEEVTTYRANGRDRDVAKARSHPGWP